MSFRQRFVPSIGNIEKAMGVFNCLGRPFLAVLKISAILLKYLVIGQAGLEAAFQVPMPGDSGSSPDAGSISNYFDLGDFSLQPQRNPYPTLTPPSC